ncbi:response regulator transcription factor [Fundicoccus culcitae]|uniref:Response regulator n=1 Tax=Fundicoccus culcitae TaxID=2969821 RepID=A0ABY5P952_9LACT|nr:response regulator [Fundicoccus culcitae]UUX35291.1 response regulator [Fundicoccus culcitae]
MFKSIIVDDEKNIRERMARHFPWGDFQFEVVGTAANGLEALKLIDDEQPDLVITDIKMPKMGGLELVEILHEKYPHIVVIILTAYRDFDLAQKAINFNVKGFLVKPIMKSDFRQMMTRIMDEPNLNQSQPAPQQTQLTADQTQPSQPTQPNQQTQPTDAAPTQPENKITPTPLARPEQTLKIRKSNNRYVNYAINYVQEHYTENITLKDIAEKLFIHEAYFSKLFNEETEVGFNAYVNYIRIENAKRLIIYSDQQLKEISTTVGFSSHSYFNRVFKQVVGDSPLSYRKKYFEDHDH